MQCGSADFQITDQGVLIPSRSLNKTKELAVDSSNDIFDALAVRNFYKTEKIHSSLPEKYFRELEWLNLESPTTATLSMKVLSVVRIPHNKAKCGSYLKLTTINGVLLLDDSEIFYDHDVFNLFSQTGFNQFTGQSSSTSSTSSLSQRRVLHHLSASHHSGEARGFRRLGSTPDLGLVGFFNTIDSYEWTCESVEKPSMPDYYSADLSYFTPCLDPLQEILYNRCAFTVDMTRK